MMHVIIIKVNIETKWGISSINYIYNMVCSMVMMKSMTMWLIFLEGIQNCQAQTRIFGGDCNYIWTFLMDFAEGSGLARWNIN